MKNSIFQIALGLTLSLTFIVGVQGQDKHTFNHDYLMPQKGKSMVELYSGIPYVAIGQYAYGFSNRFSVGIIYGLTPVSAGYGLRIKSVIAQPSENWRIYLKSPFIYYPKVSLEEKDPWLLAWPSIDVERKFKNNGRVWAGIGLVGVACTDYLFHSKGVDQEPVPGIEPIMQKEEAMTGVWNTFQLGYSKPLSDKLSCVFEVAPVMQGFKLKSKSGFLDSFPVIVTLGLSYSL